MIRAVILAITLLGLALGAGAQPAATAPGEAAPLHMRFDPPVDRPLRYRSTIDVSEAPPISPNPLDMTLVFHRHAEGGYLLTLTYDLPADFPANPLSELLREPARFRVSATGDLLALEDEAAWLDRLEARLTEYARRENLQARHVSTAMASLRAATPQARVNQFGRNLLPILAFANTELAIGESRRVPVPLVPVFGDPELRWSVTLDEAGPDFARFTRELRIDLAAAVARAAAAMGGTVPPGMEIGGTNVRRDRARVVRASGLVDSIESETVRVEDSGSTQVVERWRMERLPN